VGTRRRFKPREEGGQSQLGERPQHGKKSLLRSKIASFSLAILDLIGQLFEKSLHWTWEKCKFLVDYRSNTMKFGNTL